ncbi:hypothetical protein CNMCM7927_003786 [Aspergillus lentulus]|nr:hypothetical protein CNMCM7927_003786 [Aspergillus lentulus]
MATAEKTKEQQKQPTLQQDDNSDDYSDDYSDEDYETDDYEVSGDEAEAEDPKAQAKRRQRQQQQQQRSRQPDAVEEADDEDYSDEDDFYSDEYDDDDEDYDNQVASGKAMQPYQPAGGNQSLSQNGSMNVIPQEKQGSSLDDEEGMKLKLELNLEIEVELKAHIHGDLTLALILALSLPTRLLRRLRPLCPTRHPPGHLPLRPPDHRERNPLQRPINPPMTSFAEARARVVAMHKDSLQRLGLSDITIREYRPPHGLQIVSLVLVVATLVVFGRRSNFLPGSVFYEMVGLDRYPVLTRFCYDVAPVVVGLLLGAHLVEATLLAVKRLRPHGVRVASGLWFAWIVSNFVEGFPVWRRFDEMVREERMKRERRD